MRAAFPEEHVGAIVSGAGGGEKGPWHLPAAP